jgi:hypothetical protein
VNAIRPKICTGSPQRKPQRGVFRSLAILVVGVAGTASSSWAGTVITVPAGLSEGQQYVLAFVTQGIYSASSASITDYNNDIASDIAANDPSLSSLATWYAAIDTTTDPNWIPSIDSGESSLNVYDLSGNLLGTVADLTGGAVGIPLITDNGSATDTNRYLGSCCVWDGLSGKPAGSADAVGFIYLAGSGPYTLSNTGSTINAPSDTHTLIAISAPITAMPEPSTVILALMGGASVLYFRRRKVTRGSWLSVRPGSRNYRK